MRPVASGRSANSLSITRGQIALGTVEQIDDAYFAIDPDGKVVGTFRSQREAMRAFSGRRP
jgi:hypothetical protein